MASKWLVVGTLAVAFGLALAAPFTGQKPSKYNTSPPETSAEKINVHLVCHTHDDVGWLKTVDQYYMGANNSIQHAGVQFILDSVVPELMKDRNRRFIYVEQAFFQRWWNEQADEMKDNVRDLVARRQLVFINGGYCMHDEAGTHYVAMVDQTTLGHRFIRDEFGQTPRVGWQIDPFGHSSTQAALLSAEAGFDSLFFGRIDYQDKEKRLNESNMETLWRASESLGVDAQVLAGALYTGYGPPSGLCFDQSCSDAPVQDDPRLHDVNIQTEVDNFVAAALDQAQHYRTNHIMWTMGSDFQYENAHEWFKNLDKLIHYVNQDGRVNAMYSTPEEYTDAQHAAGLTWSVKTDDYFPYADSEHAYWTGYFTSRAALKRYVRDRSGFLQSARQLESLTAPNKPSRTAKLSEAMGLAQHHDAVSGTSKQHVAYDYAERIAAANVEAEEVVNEAIAQLTSKQSKASTTFAQCNMLNVSICHAATPSNSEATVLVVYNPLGQRRAENLMLPVTSDKLSVFEGQDKIASNILPRFDAGAEQLIQAGGLPEAPEPFTISFNVDLPPFGFRTYFIQPDSSVQPLQERADPTQDSIENAHLRVDFDTKTGRMTSITYKDKGITLAASQDYLWYNSSATFGQNSGAYIFRPNVTTPYPVNAGNINLTFVGVAGGVMEARQVWADWLTQTVRLTPDAHHIDIEWTVGSVPIDDHMGKEVVSRFTTNMLSDKTFYTDSNGRESVKRVRDYRPTWDLNVTEPVAGNYYPVNAFISIADTDNVFAVLTDRSQGGSSMSDGAIELMVQRRILADDDRGVGEPLNETLGITAYPNPERLGPGMAVRGLHRLFLETKEDAAALGRSLQAREFASPVLAFGSTSDMSQYIDDHVMSGSVLAPLPLNVDLLTLERLDTGDLLVRLAHRYGVNEDAELSKDATVDLADLFDIQKIEEMTLTANQPLKDLKRLIWEAADGAKQTNTKPAAPVAPRYTVTLPALKIRTFVITPASK